MLCYFWIAAEMIRDIYFKYYFSAKFSSPSTWTRFIRWRRSMLKQSNRKMLKRFTFQRVSEVGFIFCLFCWNEVAATRSQLDVCHATRRRFLEMRKNQRACSYVSWLVASVVTWGGAMVVEFSNWTKIFVVFLFFCVYVMGETASDLNQCHSFGELFQRWNVTTRNKNSVPTFDAENPKSR